MNTRSNILALRQRKATLAKQGRTILEAAAKEGRDLNDGERQNHEKILQSLRAVEGEIVAEEQRLVQLDSGEATPDENSAFASLARGEVPAENPSATKRPPIGRAKYAELFGRPSKSAFRGWGDFLASAARSRVHFDPRLTFGAANEASPSAGGFLVPPEQTAQVFDQALEGEIVRPRAQVWPMASDTRKIPAVQDDDHSSNVLFGGIAAGWGNELDDIDEASIKIRMMELHANRFGLLSNSSQELLDDSTYEAVLSAKFQAAAAWHLDRAYLFGDGAGKPLGCLDAGNDALIVVAKESSQAADTVVYENVTKMYSKMPPSCLSRAVWVFTSSLVPQLLKMQNRVFNLAGSEVVGGSAVPSVTVADDGSMTLFTRPVIISEKLSAPGDLGDCAFCDFSQYAIGMRREMVLESSTAPGFKNFSVWFRLVCRVDGQPLWHNVQTLQNGDTVSPFVTLQAR